MVNKIVQKVKEPEIHATINIIEGVVVNEILNYIKNNNIDLIVISTHGRSGLNKFLLGSVAEKVIRRSDCPVFTIKTFGKSIL